MVDDPGHTLENEFYKAEVDLKTGALTSLHAKQGDWEALAGPANVAAIEEDHGDVWELYKTLDGAQNVMMTRPIGWLAATRSHAVLQRQGIG